MIAPFLFLFSFSLIALVIAALTDLRERLVSNKLTYLMVAVGLSAHAAWALLAGDYWVLLNCLIATVGIFAFSLLLYRLGVWAGGDVKLFAGIAALNPFNPAILSRAGIVPSPLFAPVELPVFPFTLFIFSMIAMLPYGIFLALRRLKEHKQHSGKIIAALKLFGAGFAVVAVLGGWAFLSGMKDASFAFSGILAIWSLLFLFRLYGISKVLMRKTVKVSELKDGMIVGETIVERGGRIEREAELSITKLINQFGGNKSRERKKKEEVIVSAMRAGGVTVEEIKRLQKLAKQGKMPDTITIKESAPFVPAVLIAYAALSIIGDFVWGLLF